MDGNWGVYSCGLAGYVVKVNDDCERDRKSTRLNSSHS